MTLTPLPSEVTALTGFTHKATISYSDVSTAGGAATTAVINLLPLGPTATGTCAVGTAVVRCATRCTTAFVSSDATSCVIEVGDGGDVDRFQDSTELYSGSQVTYKISKVTTFPYAYTTADTIDAKFTVSGGSSPLCTELTAGEVEIFLGIVSLQDLTNSD